MTADLYIQSVIDHMPPGLPLREQIAMELRGHIAERLEQGQPLQDVLRQLGDPITLAESYLASVPLEPARLFPRLVAKLVDALGVVLIIGVPAALLWFWLPLEVRYFIPVVCILACTIAFVTLTVITEYRSGATPGKRLMGLRVVQDSGARISLGQSMLRQLPFFAQFYVIDALFALFTVKRQRAFELITRTRTVAVLLCVALAQ